MAAALPAQSYREATALTGVQIDSTVETAAFDLPTRQIENGGYPRCESRHRLAMADWTERPADSRPIARHRPFSKLAHTRLGGTPHNCFVMDITETASDLAVGER